MIYTMQEYAAERKRSYVCVYYETYDRGHIVTWL